MTRASAGLVGVVLLMIALGNPGQVSSQEVGGTATALESARWLSGCWYAISQDGTNAAEEHWMEPGGGLMVGMSRSIRQGVARGYEFLTLRVGDDGRLVYHAEPSGQSPTDFPATSVEAGRLEFVNREHDFPQKIVYELKDGGFLYAAVYSEADSSEPAFVIPYRRLNCPAP